MAHDIQKSQNTNKEIGRKFKRFVSIEEVLDSIYKEDRLSVAWYNFLKGKKA